MPLETATFINGLVATNPASTDTVGQADDHIRLIKSALKATFPNLTGAVTATQGALNSPFPVGGVIMWSGSIATIPLGWALCNGVEVPRSDGAGVITPPDLRNLFVVGAGGTYAVGATGGSNTATTVSAGAHTHSGSTGGTALTVAQIPSHTHTGTTSTNGDHTHTTTNGTTAFVGSRGDLSFASGGAVGDCADALGMAAAGNHSHTFTTNATGEGQVHSHTINSDGAHTHTVDTRSPYYAMAFIMKV